MGAGFGADCSPGEALDHSAENWRSGLEVFEPAETARGVRLGAPSQGLFILCPIL
jgi:hypothetical protein